ncbi:cytotoxic translational repressor of toxin-antitoxin stability system [Trujillonella endophytica]|uniref:Cytotoxic translational repressor of toxin-antitoxin stability system n=1 Tax=Trujillonella endophytica TaxID=673521 RepID=A0A1H8WPH2_9ACTN|nr:cytotoxic translational repressor of toxin-antitoxin stability system [Trujillella endophytica]SEP29551.1 hypothetical protein SAMN05660991_04609 [Trujillella endophytica]
MSGAASRRDHDRFCKTEGWDEVRNARGGKVEHHITYELPLSDSRVLRTRISRPADNSSYGPSLWTRILKDQLDVTEAEFWACVRDKQLPDRGTASTKLPEQALPASLVHQLINLAGIPEDEVAGMSLERAVEVMTALWSQPKE